MWRALYIGPRAHPPATRVPRCLPRAMSGPPRPRPARPRQQCPHARQPYECVECGGSGICKHFARRRHCNVCAVEGGTACVHGKARATCAPCKAAPACPRGAAKTPHTKRARKLCPHARQPYDCVECGGNGVCKHLARRRHCNLCAAEDGKACVHGKAKVNCTPCKTAAMCPCGAIRAQCLRCFARPSCEHGARRLRCAACSPHLLCAHGGFRRDCALCRAAGARPAPRAATPARADTPDECAWLCEGPYDHYLDELFSLV